MKSGGFIIDDNVDELALVKQKYDRLRKNEIYHLMILPTYDCNLSCWYCTQKHRRLSFDRSLIEKLKNHIVRYVSTNELKGLHLSWFGGEPLIEFDTIDEVGTFSQKFCKDHNLTFRQTITTNGTLLSEEVVEKMANKNFTFFQITIDGDKVEHDKVKVLEGTSSYDLILNNMCYAVNHLNDCEFLLRLNYTAINLNPKKIIEDLDHHINKTVRDRIQLSIKKVWQVAEEDIDIDKLNELRDGLKKNGYVVSESENFSPCYVDALHFNTVFPNGGVDKCDNLDPASTRGVLGDDGTIKWQSPIIFQEYTAFSNKATHCLQCRYLPICFGPCPDTRDKMMTSVGLIGCHLSCARAFWETNIINYCHSFDEV